MQLLSRAKTLDCIWRSFVKITYENNGICTRWKSLRQIDGHNNNNKKHCLQCNDVYKAFEMLDGKLICVCRYLIKFQVMCSHATISCNVYCFIDSHKRSVTGLIFNTQFWIIFIRNSHPDLILITLCYQFSILVISYIICVHYLAQKSYICWGKNYDLRNAFF